MDAHRQPGEQIEVVFRIEDDPFLVMPVTVVADRHDLIAHYLAPGTCFLRRVLLDGSNVPRVVRLDDLARRGSKLTVGRWHTSHRLIVTRPGAAHAIYNRWLPDSWTFDGWYVNLQEPLRRTGFGFSTQDQFLDIVVTPDLRWRWKDEDELEEAIEAGRLTRDDADAVRREGERVVADIEARCWPFDGSLESWRPDAAWTIPPLSETWMMEDR